MRLVFANIHSIWEEGREGREKKKKKNWYTYGVGRVSHGVEGADRCGELVQDVEVHAVLLLHKLAQQLLLRSA